MTALLLGYPPVVSLALFLAAACVIGFVGIQMTYLARELAVATGLAAAMLMNAVLLMGLMYRERKGIANIGMESALILVIYLGTVAYLAV